MIEMDDVVICIRSTKKLEKGKSYRVISVNDKMAVVKIGNNEQVMVSIKTLEKANTKPYGRQF